MTSAPSPPLGLLAELTHRCPLRCPYCSNPLELEQAAQELSTAEWARVFEEAAALGVLQLHLSGGEPATRRDLEAIVAHAASAGLYTNLITSGVSLDARRLGALAEAGLDHVQLSVQAADAATADRIGGMPGGHARKLAFAALVRQAGLPLTVNAVLHRQNLDAMPAIIDLALELGAGRLELAHVQYHGWAYENRAALLPSRAQLDTANAIIAAARPALRGRMQIDDVAPDYHARRPKACMGGWGSSVLVVTPSGNVLPCHAAAGLPGFEFPNVRSTPLRAIWQDSEAFNRFRGTAWMPEPCRGCERREQDWGGCRCQAFALTGDAAATDPACALSPHHAMMEAALEEAAASDDAFRYREMRRQPAPAS
ncbi:pyrroloquinoline quinone biosynthesis protein PqqE [Roseomonas marmotae]|uniref:PqqA peptide cyclase n=1 Tax=Roseomonas marmotae TaxID=2768161 RepID=A0ABS3KDN3_9PROT|nr:pyrroloquinoline quinone biosynthesis protein PqqE [Roseomonas marmotae]MBO1075540.1 pyrroloquinoline quinone biosynthesis protein PqqE [Roseomonas marmotae]QTI81531.1 pyrroloquinoline quinone biosynthesis protein PqqE [Roseomonas marmotae]